MKNEHYSRSAEINILFASCQKLLNSVLFQPDLSHAYDYQQMVKSNTYTKKQLDTQLRICHIFINNQIEAIEKAIQDNSVNVTP